MFNKPAQTGLEFKALHMGSCCLGFKLCWLNLQEDVCLMMKVDGKLRLMSGAVLFPQRWHLLEKTGMDMRSIHLPVPLYADVIGSTVDQFMDRLKVGKPVWRANWAIVDDPTLFQPLNEV